MNDKELLNRVENSLDYNIFKLNWEMRKLGKIMLNEVVEKKNVIKSMYKIFNAIIIIWWILDICNANIPQLQSTLNDSNGLNGLFWLLVLTLGIHMNTTINNKKGE